VLCVAGGRRRTYGFEMRISGRTSYEVIFF